MKAEGMHGSRLTNHAAYKRPSDWSKVENMLAPIVNTIGLCMDVIGVVLLFKYGVNRNPTLSPHGHITGFREGTELDQEAIKQYWKYKKLEDGGLILLILGFGAQALATWLSYIQH